MTTDIPTNEQLLGRIKAFCDKYGLGYSAFGKRAVNDGSLLAGLEKGRSPTTKMLTRINAAMEQIEREFEPVTEAAT